ncbi:MAG: cation:proton antiporter [Candidatus Marinimicrobia bacterium CG08_land_8_20_14_0_20_45_22]|nr:MAG: cation:proton antiporter [Candidatus Marinimicrobia bacterium CG08_land_8_20_14_0_20_45_22]
MRKLVILILLLIITLGVFIPIQKIPFGKPRTEIADYYINNGKEQTGAANIVTSVVISYRGFDTLGEVTVLFLATIGLGTVLATVKRKEDRKTVKASLILSTGCKFLFPLILLFGAYIFLHGHLTPGGGFQGGAVIASAFVLMYLGCHNEKRINETGSVLFDSIGGLTFIVVGLVGLAIGTGYFLYNFLPLGKFNTLMSAGIIPIIYIAIGFKVGSELSKIIDLLMEES